MSHNAYYESIEAGISMITNQDADLPAAVICQVLQIIFDFKGIDSDLKCPSVKPLNFACILDDVGSP